MLIRYFDQKVQKSRFTLCDTSMVPFWYHLVPQSQLVPKLVHIFIFLLESFYINKDLLQIVPGNFFKGQFSETQTVVKKGCKR